MSEKFKARVKQFLHCLWGTVRFQSHQGMEIVEDHNGEETYFYIGCTCGVTFFEEGTESDWDDFEDLLDKDGYDN